jgi:hypothetical protein
VALFQMIRQRLQLMIFFELSKLSSYIKQRIIINRIHFTLQEEEIHN